MTVTYIRPSQTRVRRSPGNPTKTQGLSWDVWGRRSWCSAISQPSERRGYCWPGITAGCGRAKRAKCTECCQRRPFNAGTQVILNFLVAVLEGAGGTQRIHLNVMCQNISIFNISVNELFIMLVCTKSSKSTFRLSAISIGTGTFPSCAAGKGLEDLCLSR